LPIYNNLNKHLLYKEHAFGPEKIKMKWEEVVKNGNELEEVLTT